MRPNREAVQTALRALAAISLEMRHPTAADLAAMRRLRPSLESLAPDELAREIIQEWLSKNGKGSTGR